MKYLYPLLIGLAISTAASAQILKTENDPKTGQEIKSAVTILGNGMRMQLNFFARGNDKLIEFAHGGTIGHYSPAQLKIMVINIKLKNDSVYHFRTDSTKYTITQEGPFDRLSLVAVVKDEQLMPLQDSQVRSIGLSIGDGKGVDIPPISDNNRREIKKAVAYVMGGKK